MQDCNNSIANALELLQSNTKLSISYQLPFLKILEKMWWYTAALQDLMLFGDEGGIFQGNLVSTMSADTIVPCVSRLSTDFK